MTMQDLQITSLAKGIGARESEHFVPLIPQATELYGCRSHLKRTNMAIISLTSTYGC
jgi:hypothetical protein